MKTIGLIGGMSWESTAHYYEAINKGIKTRRGGLHSASIVLVSLDFQVIAELQNRGDWQQSTEILGQAAAKLEAAGADFFIICTNTMHKVAEAVQRYVNIPLLHIADATGQVLTDSGISKVGLLGTRFTMADDFYHQRLVQGFDIQTLVPDADAQNIVHRVIYDELCLGTINTESKAAYLDIIQSLQQDGAQGVILGCTEIAMLVQQADTAVTLFDTTALHAQAAVDFALANDCEGNMIGLHSMA